MQKRTLIGLETGLTIMSEAHINESLRETLVLQLPVLVEELDSSTTFLTCLAKHNLIEPIDVNKYQVISYIYKK